VLSKLIEALFWKPDEKAEYSLISVSEENEEDKIKQSTSHHVAHSKVGCSSRLLFIYTFFTIILLILGGVCLYINNRRSLSVQPTDAAEKIDPVVAEVDITENPHSIWNRAITDEDRKNMEGLFYEKFGSHKAGLKLKIPNNPNLKPNAWDIMRTAQAAKMNKARIKGSSKKKTERFSAGIKQMLSQVQENYAKSYKGKLLKKSRQRVIPQQDRDFRSFQK